MEKTFCTIVTNDHLGVAYALGESLYALDPAISLHILIVDRVSVEVVRPSNPRIKILTLNDLGDAPFLSEILDKYANDDLDKVRWSLKPVFISFLLRRGWKKVVFTDPDTYYFSDFSFLFDELDRHKVLLTPHWRSQDPYKDSTNFDLLFLGGHFNAGFFGANSEAQSILHWWTRVCLHECEKSFSKGKYVDQSYLNLMPIYFDSVGLVKHKGCNVANWNQLECARTVTSEGIVLINNTWPIVFIHFTASTIYGILSGDDKLLTGFLSTYKESVAKYGGVILPSLKRGTKKVGLIGKVYRRLKKIF